MKAILLISSLVASAPAASDTFAIACSGDTLSVSVVNGTPATEIFDLSDQVFVFSESAKSALRALPPMETFESLCAIDTEGRELEFSADGIRIFWTSPAGWDAKTTCEFTFDRTTSAASMRTTFDWSDRNRSQSDWRMTCTPTQIPVFALDER